MPDPVDLQRKEFGGDENKRLRKEIARLIIEIENVVVGATRDIQGRSKAVKALKKGGRVTKVTSLHFVPFPVTV